MALTRPSYIRALCATGLVMASMIWATPSLAQDQPALPDYVVEEFGTPPAIPTGPLSADVQAAAEVAFVDGMAQNS